MVTIIPFSIKRLWLVMAMIAIACGPGREDAQPSNLSPAEFQSKREGSVVLVDVRSPEELESQYLAGAHNIDFRNNGFRNILTMLNKEQTYLVYCASGIRSGKAADMMKELGFAKVYTLDGGLQAWNDAKLPVQEAKILPADYRIEMHGQSISVMKGDESVAELTCAQAVGDACLAFGVSIGGPLEAGDQIKPELFYSRQEALDWITEKLQAK